MKQKSWTDNEKALKNFLSEKFGLRGICIEKKDRNNNTTRTIVAKLNSFECIF